MLAPLLDASVSHSLLSLSFFLARAFSPSHSGHERIEENHGARERRRKMPEGPSRSGYANWGSFVPHVSAFIRIESAVTRVSLLVRALRARVRRCFCGINREEKTIKRRRKKDERARVSLVVAYEKKGSSSEAGRCRECRRVL